MLQLGKKNTLKVLRSVDFGFYLDAEDYDSVLLPIRYAPKDLKEGDEIEVFIYLDSEDRLIATTEEPFAEVGEFAYLKVKDMSKFGAFLDWGLPKDLFVPYREQKMRMERNKSYWAFFSLSPAFCSCALSLRGSRVRMNSSMTISGVKAGTR